MFKFKGFSALKEKIDALVEKSESLQKIKNIIDPGSATSAEMTTSVVRSDVKHDLHAHLKMLANTVELLAEINEHQNETLAELAKNILSLQEEFNALVEKKMEEYR